MGRRARWAAGAGVAIAMVTLGRADAADEIAETPPEARLMGGVAGTQLVGLPTTRVVGSLTNLTAPCQQISPLRGVLADGQMIDVGGFTRHYVEVVPDAGLDLDVYFYDGACQRLAEHIGLEGGYDDSFDAAGMGGIERGFVPPEAAFAEVAGYAGTGAFVMAIYDVRLPG